MSTKRLTIMMMLLKLSRKKLAILRETLIKIIMLKNLMKTKRSNANMTGKATVENQKIASFPIQIQFVNCISRQESAGDKHVGRDILKFVVTAINAIEEVIVDIYSSTRRVKDAKPSIEIAIIVSSVRKTFVKTAQ